MKLLGALPALKALGVIAVAGGFAGAIALGATRDRTPPNFAQQSTVPTPSATRIAERPTVAPPILGARTAIPGLDKGGLFADGVTNLTKVDTAGWRTYSNTKYGYSFKYPPNWVLSETDNTGRTGPQGQLSYPLQWVEVSNPLPEQGENIPGTNCQGAACIGSPPKALGFLVSITNGLCNTPADLIATDSVTVNGRQGSRCVVQSPNDKVSRGVAIGLPLGDGTNFIEIGLRRGRAITPSEQSVLETILSTFTR